MLNTFVAVAVAVSAAVAVAQAPRISPADVHGIAAAVIEDVAPDTGKLGTSLIKGRPLFFDEAAFFSAIQKLVVGPVPTDLILARPFANAPGAAVTHCWPPGSCHIEYHGIVVTVRDAAFDAASGQVRVHAAVEWDSSFVKTNWFVADLFLAKTGSEWRVVRHGSYATS